MLVEGRKYARADLGHVLVLGLGVSGKAVVDYAAPLVGGRVRSITVLGGHANEDVSKWADAARAKFPSSGLRVLFDEEDAESALPEGVERFDVCVASPGISMFSDFYQNAAKASEVVISEVEFAWCESAEDSVWVAVTGTNGKTTTTSLVEHLLRHAGLLAKAVGNIGDACITQVARDNSAEALTDRAPGVASPSEAPQPASAGQENRGISEAPRFSQAEAAVGQGASEGLCKAAASATKATSKNYYVVECSSYQLASIDRFAPNVAVVLGITPDHIKWHRTHEHYAESKFKLLSHLADTPGAVAVLDATNDEVRAKVREIKASEQRGFEYIPIGTKDGVEGDMREACGAENAAFVTARGSLEVAFRDLDVMVSEPGELKILGRHNQLNALASAAAALACGVDALMVREGLSSFAPLEHRIEPSGIAGGVGYYNDSKATNVDATLQALKAFLPKKPIVMLGGEDKGTDLAQLVEACRKHAKAVVCFGKAGERFYGEMCVLADEGIGVLLVESFDDAFAAATDAAEEGDIVLLSPACASFDEFSCFEERGEHFKDLVRRLGR